MGMPNKMIVTCAVTGSIHTPSMSPYLPVTADEIAEAAIGAAEAGASILHLHARHPQTGKPDQTPQAFEPFLKIHQAAVELYRQPDDGRKPVHVRGRTIEACGDVPAGGCVAQHGIDEFRSVPNAPAL
ncbi:MAG TPA: 3-keto-5-aminohexanoate cleavage protein [Acetobacteraceae bacterium]|nr:3-keto-5-aminohexanoate cleavage protein [Acetobacteraceae bacterium]